MLAHVYATGFRSLRDFHLEINPGLNVLIGPNGSGKTTIIRLFEFLSFLSEQSLPEAVSRAGGAGEIFDRSPENEGKDNIGIQFNGAGSVIGFVRERMKIDRIEYEFSCEITFDRRAASIYFSQQTLRVKFHQIEVERTDDAWDLVIRYNRALASEGATGIDFEVRPTVPETERKRLQSFKELITERSDLVQEYPLFSAAVQFLISLYKIRIDVASGQAFSVIPDRVKQSEDIAKTPKINPDGSGLSATLYRLQRVEEQGFEQSAFLFSEPTLTYRPNTLQQIRSYVRLVNDSISSIRVSADPDENRLRTVATIKGSQTEFDVPLAYLSDGTVKWLALVTAVLTSQSIFSIEEPENFLHPKMQQEIVEIIRSVCREDGELFSIMTTHSESLLNCLTPEEVVIVRFAAGITTASRLDDQSKIREEIQRTGFGLGWYYVTEAFDG